MLTSSLRLFSGLVLVLTVVGVSGCSGSENAAASGTVTLRGSALKTRVVLNFVGPDNVPHSTHTDDSGAFTISGLAVGKTRVTVVALPEGGPAPRPLKNKAAQGQRLATQPAENTEVPAEYSNAANPQLSFDLLAGDNVLNIDLGNTTN